MEEKTYLESMEKRHNTQLSVPNLFKFCIIPFLVITLIGVGLSQLIDSATYPEGKNTLIMMFVAAGAFMALMSFIGILGRYLLVKKNGTLDCKSTGEDSQDVRRYIEDAEANGEVLIRTKWDKHGVLKYAGTKNYEVMLLDKYILFEDLVVPVEQIRWVVDKNTNNDLILYFDNKRRVIKRETHCVAIFCDSNYIAVYAKDEAEAKQMTAQFNQYLPNYIGEYTKELEKMWIDDTAGFIELSKQKKKEYEEKNNAV